MRPLALALAWGAGCSSPAARVVTVYTPSTCQATGPTAQYTATGDFSPPPSESASLSPVGAPLSMLPAETRSMLVQIEGWTGVSLVDPAGPLDVLALPMNRICSLPDKVSTPFADTDPGETIGLIDAHHALLVGGSSEAPLASVIDLGTGAIVAATPTLVLARNDASVTSFGKGALVAGGLDPMTGAPQNSAEVYAPSPSGGAGGFTTQEVLPLNGGARAKHGAVQLASGETLLVGGTMDGTHALATLEYIAPGAKTSTALPKKVTLQTPRIHPTVLKLPTGKIFVGGGFDDSGAPVESVEWFDADLTALQSSGALPAVTLCMTAKVSAFVPLEGGAVLAVFGKAPPPGPPACSNVMVIRANYTVDLAAPLSPPPSAPMLLFAGAVSRPVLITGGTVRQRDPWTGEWSALPGVGALSSLPTTAMLSADPGLALWVAQSSFVNALRFATRNTYSTDTAQDAPLLVDDAGEFAPDRLAGTDATFVAKKGVELRNGASAFLTDATFADFSIDFAATGVVQVVLRDNDTGVLLPFVEGTCLPLPGKGPTSMKLVRKGATVSAGTNGQLTPCMTSLLASERVAVGFQGTGPDAATVTSVVVQRLGPTD